MNLLLLRTVGLGAAQRHLVSVVVVRHRLVRAKGSSTSNCVSLISIVVLPTNNGLANNSVEIKQILNISMKREKEMQPIFKAQL